MSTRQDELERELRHRIRTETEALAVDTAAAAGRLEGRLARVDRRRRGAVVAVAVIAAAAAALAVLVHPGVDPRPQPAAPPSVTVRPLGEIDVRRPFFYDLGTGTVRPVPSSLVPASLRDDTGHDDFHLEVSPDGTQVAYVCHGGDADCLSFDAIVVASLDGTVLHRWRLPADTTDRVAWSPDGTSIAYALHAHGAPGPGGLFVQDVATGRRTRLVDASGPPPGPNTRSGGVAFTADGGSVMFTSWDLVASREVWSVPVAGGPATLVRPGAADPFRLPGGGYGFLTGGSPPGTDLVIDRGSSRRALVRSDEELSWPAVSPDGTRIVFRADDHLMLVDVASGAVSTIAEGRCSASWVDDRTLLLTPASPPGGPQDG